MMISPGMFMAQYENANYLDLIEARNDLINSLVSFEEKEMVGNRTGFEWDICPSPDVRYQCCLDYLAELCNFMREKYRVEYAWGGRRLCDDVELKKKRHTLYPEIYAKSDNASCKMQRILELPLDKIGEILPELEQALRDDAFSKANVEGGYKCANCDKVFPNRQSLRVNHIVPLNQGGLTTPENLQVLCLDCSTK